MQDLSENRLSFELLSISLILTAHLNKISSFKSARAQNMLFHYNSAFQKKIKCQKKPLWKFFI